MTGATLTPVEAINVAVDGLDIQSAGAGTQAILCAKSETFWCPMSTAASPCWATDRAWETRKERLREVAVRHLVNDVVGRVRAFKWLGAPTGVPLAAIEDPFAGHLMRSDASAGAVDSLSRSIPGLGSGGKFSSGRIAFGLGAVATSRSCPLDDLQDRRAAQGCG